MREFVVQFLTRDGCHLCDEIRPDVERIVRRLGGQVEEVDVDENEDLTSAYGARIPVILSRDGIVIAEGRIRGKELKRRLRESY